MDTTFSNDLVKALANVNDCDPEALEFALPGVHLPMTLGMALHLYKGGILKLAENRAHTDSSQCVDFHNYAQAIMCTDLEQCLHALALELESEQG